MVRHYLNREPAEEIDRLMEQYVEAAWVEERTISAMAAAIAKAFGGK